MPYINDGFNIRCATMPLCHSLATSPLESAYTSQYVTPPSLPVGLLSSNLPFFVKIGRLDSPCGATKWLALAELQDPSHSHRTIRAGLAGDGIWLVTISIVHSATSCFLFGPPALSKTPRIEFHCVVKVSCPRRFRPSLATLRPNQHEIVRPA